MNSFRRKQQRTVSGDVIIRDERMVGRRKVKNFHV